MTAETAAPAHMAAASPYDFKAMLFASNPFDEIELDGIDEEGIEADLQGWGANHGAFRAVIEDVRPATIPELGTWKGASAIHMAQLCQARGIAARILFIDRFIGFPASISIRKRRGRNSR